MFMVDPRKAKKPVKHGAICSSGVKKYFLDHKLLITRGNQTFPGSIISGFNVNVHVNVQLYSVQLVMHPAVF